MNMVLSITIFIAIFIICLIINKLEEIGGW